MLSAGPNSSTYAARMLVALLFVASAVDMWLLLRSVLEDGLDLHADRYLVGDRVGLPGAEQVAGDRDGHDSRWDPSAAWGREPESGVVSRYRTSSTRSVNFQPSGVRR